MTERHRGRTERARTARAYRLALLALGVVAISAASAIEWHDDRAPAAVAAARADEAESGAHRPGNAPAAQGGGQVRHGDGEAHAARGGGEAHDEHGAGEAHDEHGAGGEAHHGGPPELDNILNMLGVAHGAVWLNGFVGPDQLFMLLYIIVLVAVAAAATRALKHLPGPFQNAVEFVVETLSDFLVGVLGARGRRFVPFLGTLFIYILFMNYAGLIPFLKAPTNSLNTTLALAACVFLYVQWTGMRMLGLVGYLDHLAGEPRDVVGWVLVPLMLPLHIVGEFVKPMSLSLRLFGNITGEDALLAVFVGFGMSLYGVLHLPLADWLGLPLQVIVYPLLLIFGFIQALVFTLLSAIYFYLMLPHEEHH